MKISDILLIVAAIVAMISLIRIRVMYMMKGKKVKAYVKTYVENQAYFPVMEFEYGGEVINMKTFGGFKTKKYDIGKELEILYIPGKTDGVKIVSDYTDVFYAAVFFVAAVVLIVAEILR